WDIWLAIGIFMKCILPRRLFGRFWLCLPRISTSAIRFLLLKEKNCTSEVVGVTMIAIGTDGFLNSTCVPVNYGACRICLRNRLCLYLYISTTTICKIGRASCRERDNE